MCGIFGYSFKNPPGKRLRKRLGLLAACNDARGGQSWGMYDAFDHKESPDSPTGIVSRGLGLIGSSKKQFYGTRGFGHTRWATTGKVVVENSHPFQIGEILGAHNGIIYNHWELGKKYERNYEVDSEHIFHHIAEGRDLTDLSGYGSIEWMDLKDHKAIYIARLDGGELSVAKIPEGIVWTSDQKHLHATFGDIIETYYTIPADGQVYRVVDGDIWTVTGHVLKLGTRTSYRSWDSYREPSTSSSYWDTWSKKDKEELDQIDSYSKWEDYRKKKYGEEDTGSMELADTLEAMEARLSEPDDRFLEGLTEEEEEELEALMEAGLTRDEARSFFLSPEEVAEFVKAANS